MIGKKQEKAVKKMEVVTKKLKFPPVLLNKFGDLDGKRSVFSFQSEKDKESK